MGSEVWIDRKRLDCRLGAICTLAKLAGALFVFLYLVELAPGVTIEEVQDATESALIVAPGVAARP